MLLSRARRTYRTCSPIYDCYGWSLERCCRKGVLTRLLRCYRCWQTLRFCLWRRVSGSGYGHCGCLIPDTTLSRLALKLTLLSLFTFQFPLLTSNCYTHPSLDVTHADKIERP